MKNSTHRRFPILGLLAVALFQSLEINAAEPTALDLQLRGFFHGREYFMVRSGRVQWIIQADRADLGPAVTAYLFDANVVSQNAKRQAYNFDETAGVRSTALEVVAQRSKFAFTAFGEQTRVRWTDLDGIPAVEATWWADGVRVSERFSGIDGNNTVRRTISLTAANLHGDEQYTLRLRLPAGSAAAANRALFVTRCTCPQALVIGGNEPVKMDTAKGVVEIGPVALSPDKTLSIETYLLAQVPANTQTAADFQKQIARASDSRLLEATRARWAKTSRIDTDDAVVREVFDHTRAILPAIVSESGRFRPGPFQYPMEWVRDDSQYTLGLTSAGHFELARAVLEHCIRDMITAEGTTMIGGGFDNPDREQFDQGGELMLALRWYTEFSGDNSLVETYRAKLIALVERPLNPAFRDATGLVHNRREFWEQTMNDAYELAYNTYVIVGLREAAALASQLGAEDRKEHWLKEADATQAALFKVMVSNNTLIKRRNVSGEIAKHLVYEEGSPDVPCRCAAHNMITPDATMALPLAFGLVEPKSALATNTLNEIEKLRSQRWWGGGYARYDSTSEINMPGPWGIAARWCCAASMPEECWIAAAARWSGSATSKAATRGFITKKFR